MSGWREGDFWRASATPKPAPSPGWRLVLHRRGRYHLFRLLERLLHFLQVLVGHGLALQVLEGLGVGLVLDLPVMLPDRLYDLVERDPEELLPRVHLVHPPPVEHLVEGPFQGR